MSLEPKLKPKLALSVVICAGLPFIAPPVKADDQVATMTEDRELSDLKAQIRLLTERLNRLEAKEHTSTQVQAQTPQAQAQTAGSNAPPRTPPDTPAALKTDNSGNLLGVLNRPVMLYDDANTSLRLYGIIEVTISDATNQNSKGQSAIGYQTAWFSGNRLGFDIDHALKLGDRIGLPELKVISKLETEFESPTGNFDTPGVVFNRDAWLGLYSPRLGKLTFGRQNTLTRDFTQTWGDPYGTPYVTLREGGYSNVNNYKQLIYYSGSDTSQRNNSAVVWKKRFGPHWVVGFDYGFGSNGVGGSGNGCSYAGSNYGSCFNTGGGGTPGQFSLGSSKSASLAYNDFALAGGKLSGNINYNWSNQNGNIDQSVLVGGTFVKSIFRVGGGYIHYKAQQGANNSAPLRHDNVWTANASIRFLPDTDLYMGYTRTIGHNTGLGANGDVIEPFIQYSSNVTQVVSGSRVNATLSVMYHADKQTDFYVATDYMRGYDGWSHTLFDVMANNPGALRADSKQMMFGIGFRFKF